MKVTHSLILPVMHSSAGNSCVLTCSLCVFWYSVYGLGSGSDFVVFLQNLGIASSDYCYITAVSGTDGALSIQYTVYTACTLIFVGVGGGDDSRMCTYVSEILVIFTFFIVVDSHVLPLHKSPI